MKRLFIVALFVAMWQSVFAYYGFSAVAPSGQTLYYRILSEGGVTVTYPGSSSNRWNGYSKPTGNLTIPDSVTYGGTTYAVTSIENHAFEDCSGLTSVTIPNSVTSIGVGAFENCNGLTTVHFNADSCRNAGGSYSNRAFYGCHSITTFTFGNNVKIIPSYLCYDMDSLTSVTIPNSVTSTGEHAFWDCSGLTTVHFNADSCTYAGGSDRAFYNCPNITTFTFGNNVKIIPDYLCYDMDSLTSVTIPNSVISIGHNFQSCDSLTSIIVDSENGVYDSRNNCNAIIETATNTLLTGCRNTTIPNTVTHIGNFAFAGCSGLASVTIPNTVTHIGNFAFSGCSGLTSVTIPNSVTSIGREAFKNCSGLTTVHFNADSCTYAGYSYPNTYSAFSGCHNITTFIFGNNVMIIPNYLCYDMDGLTSVTIPNSVTSIGMRAFENCSGLMSVTIPNSVTSIGSYAFSSCSGLTSVTIGNSVSSIGSDAFKNCSGLTSVTIPNSVMYIEGFAFRDCSGLTSVTLGSGVDYIGDYAFAGCIHLRSIVSKATYPPICFSGTFVGVPSYCTLTVPCGSLPYYSVQSPWDTQFPLKQEDCRTEYTLIVESADPTMGYVVGGGTALNGDTVVICAVGNPGYRFLRWQDGNTDSVRTIVVRGNATYTAYFAETVGVEDVADGEGVRVWSYDGRIHVVGAEGMNVNVYDILGRRINGKRKVESGKLELAVPAGVYLVRIGDLPARKVVVIRS